MKTIFKIMVSIILILGFVSCSNDDNSGKSLQNNILENFLNDVNYENSFIVTNGDAYEMGLGFKPTKKGNIKVFKIKIPTSKSIRVTLWEKQSQNIIFSTTIETEAETWIKKEINSIPLEVNKEYILSMNIVDWYDYGNNNAIDFPVSSGDFIFTNFYYRGTNQQLFPNLSNNPRYWGMLDFEFQQE